MQEFLNKKTFSPAPPVVLNSDDYTVKKNTDLEVQPVNKCDFCDDSFKTTKGLNIHERKKHPMTLSPIKQLDGAVNEMMELVKEHEKWENENSKAMTVLDEAFREHEERFTNVIYGLMTEYKKFMESLSPIKQLDMAVDDITLEPKVMIMSEMDMAFGEHEEQLKNAMDGFRNQDIPVLYNAILSYAY